MTFSILWGSTIRYLVHAWLPGMDTTGSVREGRKDRHMDIEPHSKAETGWTAL